LRKGIILTLAALMLALAVIGTIIPLYYDVIRFKIEDYRQRIEAYRLAAFRENLKRELDHLAHECMDWSLNRNRCIPMDYRLKDLMDDVKKEIKEVFTRALDEVADLVKEEYAMRYYVHVIVYQKRERVHAILYVNATLCSSLGISFGIHCTEEGGSKARVATMFQLRNEIFSRIKRLLRSMKSMKFCNKTLVKEYIRRRIRHIARSTSMKGIDVSLSYRVAVHNVSTLNDENILEVRVILRRVTLRESGFMLNFVGSKLFSTRIRLEKFTSEDGRVLCP